MRAGRALAVAAATAAAVLPLTASPARAAEPPVAMVVAPAGGGVVRDGRPLDVDVEVTNTGTERIPAGRLTASMTRGPIAGLSELTTLPNELQGFRLTRTSGRTPALGPGASAEVRLRIPAKDLDETLTSADGARLLDVQLQADRTRVLAQSAVVRMSRDAPDVGFGTVVPVTAPAGTTGVVDVAQQADLTRADGAWTEALEAARALPAATVALDPAVLASIRLAGDAAPASATAFLADLRDLGNETVRLAYADGDVTLQRAAGLTAPLGPGSFAGASTTAQSTATPAPTAAATPAPTSSAEPAEQDPTEWDWSSTRVVWPVPGTTTGGDLGALAADGTVLLGSDDVSDTAERAAAGPLATVSGRRTLVADATTSGLLAAAAAADDVRGRSAAASLMAALATDATTGAAPAVLAVAGRGADAGGLARVLALLRQQAWIRGEDLASLSRQDRPVGIALKSLSTPSGRIATARDLATAEREVQRVARAAEDPAALQGPYRLALLGALSAQWRGDDDGWARAASSVQRTLTAMPQQVTIEDAGATTVSTDGRLTVQVRNQLPQAITVDVTATVDSNRLQFDSAGRVKVPAGAVSPTRLDFRSISNGPAVVTLSLSTPKGSSFGSPVEQPVTVRAGFDTIVAVILLGALGLLLALGVYRNVTRRRRRTAAA